MTGAFKSYLDIFQHATGMRRHDDDPVGQENCLVDTVRDKDDRLPVHLPYTQQLFLEQHPRVRVKRPEGLVHEQHVWIVRKGPRDRRALAHTA